MSSYQPSEHHEPFSENPDHEVMCPGCGLCMTGEDLYEAQVDSSSDFVSCPLCLESFDAEEFVRL